MATPSLDSGISSHTKQKYDLQTLQQLIAQVHTTLAHPAKLSEVELAQAAGGALQSLQDFCDQRFQAEEQSPLYSKPSEQDQSLAGRIGKLVNQHRSLREQLSALKCSMSQNQSAPAGWAAFAERFADFERQILTHEHAEIALWEEAYSRDVGTKD